MAAAHPKEFYERVVETINECLDEGFKPNPPKGERGAFGEAAVRLDIAINNLQKRLDTARRLYGLAPDLTRYRKPTTKPVFTVDPLPHDGEPTADELIAALTARHTQRKTHHDAAKLRQVRVLVPGPVGIAMFGDPHVDDPGCAWGPLESDVRLCRDTPGILAVDVGDDSNNWVGRLQKLYADQEVTSRQSLKLIEWLIGSLPWLLRIKGNHDSWNTEKGDTADYVYRMLEQLGVHEASGQRMEIFLPTGSSFRMHVRHDFPGNSQFNPAHAIVRETLFGYSDHILACGHRHSTGYMPIWRPEPHRLCHGFRCGTYKDFDHYAKDKGFQDSNWGRALGATVDPDYADDPVRYIKPWFNLEDMAEYLVWRRAKWDTGKTHS